jgi:hypothetical protein
MRARNIKPGLWKDEDLAALPVEARYLFPGLWCMADCKGRLEDRPRLIKSELFPFDDAVGAAKVHHLLQLLHDAEFITRYEVAGRQYIQVINFERHQNPHKQEKAKGSQIPDPPMVDVRQKKTEVVPLNSDVVPIKTEEHRNLTESLGMIPDSLLLIPDPLIPDTGNTNPRVRVFSEPTPKPAERPSQRFEEFWERYPVKEGRDLVAGLWVSLVTIYNEDKVFACLDRYLASERAQRSPKNANNWLHDCSRDKWESDWPKSQIGLVRTKQQANADLWSEA